jgi:hypothetical protein
VRTLPPILWLEVKVSPRAVSLALLPLSFKELMQNPLPYPPPPLEISPAWGFCTPPLFLDI